MLQGLEGIGLQPHYICDGAVVSYQVGFYGVEL